MKSSPIGVFDSGIGGLTILAKLIDFLPQEDFIYYADSIHHPYGEKTNEDIIKCSILCVEELMKHQCKLIVVACNTASLNAIDVLREKFPDLLFVVTYPAVKVAIDKEQAQSVLLMATPASIKSEKLHHFVSSIDQKEVTHFLPCPNLANLIEHHKEDVDTYLKELLNPWQGKVDCIVLGCTHYPFIRNQIKKIINVPIIDGSSGIAKRVETLLKDNQLKNEKEEQGTICFINSSLKGEDKKTKELFYQYRKR